MKFTNSFTNSTSSFSVSSSIDGLNWVGEFSYTNFYPLTTSSSFTYSSTTSQSFSGINTSSFSSSFTNSIYPYYSNSTSSIFRPTSPHRVRYFIATYTSSYTGSGGCNVIGSVYLVSGQWVMTFGRRAWRFLKLWYSYSWMLAEPSARNYVS